MSGEENSRGFSLLETMTVICLILVLATISEPFYLTIARRAREAALRDELFTMRSQIDRFTHDYERGPASLDELVEKQYMGAGGAVASGEWIVASGRKESPKSGKAVDSG